MLVCFLRIVQQVLEKKEGTLERFVQGLLLRVHEQHEDRVGRNAEAAARDKETLKGRRVRIEPAERATEQERQACLWKLPGPGVEIQIARGGERSACDDVAYVRTRTHNVCHACTACDCPCVQHTAYNRTYMYMYVCIANSI